MSGRLLKKVLKEHEESKHPNHHDEEEEEEEEEDVGGRSSINPFDLLNEGDDDHDSDKEIEIDDEEKKNEDADNAQLPSKNKSMKKKKKKKKSKESRSNVVVKPETNLDETLEALSLGTNSKQEEVQETKQPSSRPVLEIDPKYLNLENELRRMYGSKVVRSLESSSQAGAGGSSRQGRGGRRGVHHITKIQIMFR